MEAVLIILGMALLTFLTRFGMIAALNRELPPGVSRWLQYVPVAVFPALVVPALVAPGGRPGIGPEFWAGLAGLVAARRTGQVVPALLAGMAVYWLLRTWQG